MPANHDCGCEEKGNPHPDNTLQLLEALGAEIAKMPSEDMFDLPVGRVRAAFQNVYDIAAGMLGRGQEEFLIRGRQDTYECYPAASYMPEMPEGDSAHLRTYVDWDFYGSDESLPMYQGLLQGLPIALVANWAHQGGKTSTSTG